MVNVWLSREEEEVEDEMRKWFGAVVAYVSKGKGVC